MIDRLIEDLKLDEGFRDAPYQDRLGFWTIGYGSLIDARKPVRIPRDVAELWLKSVAREKYQQLCEKQPWLQQQPEDVRRALGNMAYQLGVTGVLNFKRMLAALKAGDRRLAAKEALDSTWSQQTPERAVRVAALIRGK